MLAVAAVALAVARLVVVELAVAEPEGHPAQEPQERPTRAEAVAVAHYLAQRLITAATAVPASLF